MRKKFDVKKVIRGLKKQEKRELVELEVNSIKAQGLVLDMILLKMTKYNRLIKMLVKLSKMLRVMPLKLNLKVT